MRPKTEPKTQQPYQKCVPKRGQFWRQLLFAAISTVYRCFLVAAIWAACMATFMAAFWAAFLATPFREESKDVFRQRPRRTQGALVGRKAHVGPTRSISYTRFNSNKDVPDKPRRDVRGSCRNKQATLWYATNVVKHHHQSIIDNKVRTRQE